MPQFDFVAYDSNELKGLIIYIVCQFPWLTIVQEQGNVSHYMYGSRADSAFNITVLAENIDEHSQYFVKPES